eukprot:CAMPEP_0196662366 /NCGR_PEP_ID=MMETSP1086-20130531/48378_1 /TAXON_ID=77921 /ORGANISM="Cyanoptyche  gloeocystis , Strain SAG4.97" /LENGTH=147 /DNA_ID=CAMNT_0041997713 /DNA_START=248 /DNA_END=689 /DNA_ORIENTATION=-
MTLGFVAADGTVPNKEAGLGRHKVQGFLSVGKRKVSGGGAEDSGGWMCGCCWEKSPGAPLWTSRNSPPAHHSLSETLLPTGVHTSLPTEWNGAPMCSWLLQRQSPRYEANKKEWQRRPVAAVRKKAAGVCAVAFGKSRRVPHSKPAA